MRILTDSRQMKRCDGNTIHHFKIPSLVLMERAALGVAEEIQKRFKTPGRALIVCGTGNNGGDGLAAGRILWQSGWKVTLVMPEDRKKISAETKAQLESLKAYGIPVLSAIPEEEYDVVADALFGIGMSRPVEGIFKEYLNTMNRRKGYKIAVDVPSGIHADSGGVMGTAFRADTTVTFAFEKLGLILYPGAEYAGEVIVKEIGIGPESFLEETPVFYCPEEKDLLQIPRRNAYTNKGSFGKVLVAAGHKNMAGAAFFAAKAAYLTGVGLVKLDTEEENREILQQLLPEAILSVREPGTEREAGLAEESEPDSGHETEVLKQSVTWASVIAAGPGLGTGSRAERTVKTILQTSRVPVILDADALNIAAGHREWLKQAECPVIITPHLGEMARLVQKSIFDIQKQLLQVARQFAEEYNVICVLKDARTITALPDGRTYVNTSGNNGMATAGAGDVLTGIITGLAAQGMEPEQAAWAGVYLHGKAANLMAEETGTYSLMARDILRGIPKAMMKINEA